MERDYRGKTLHQSCGLTEVKVFDKTASVDRHSSTSLSHNNKCATGSEQGRNMGTPEILKNKQRDENHCRNPRPFREPNQTERIPYMDCEAPQTFRPRAASDNLPKRHRLIQTGNDGGNPDSAGEGHLPHCNQQLHRGASAGTMPQARDYRPGKAPSSPGRQRPYRENSWFSRARARSDTHLHKKHGRRHRDGHATSDSTALIGSSSASSSAAEDDWANHLLADKIESTDMLESHAIIAENCRSSNFTTKSTIKYSTTGDLCNTTSDSNHTKDRPSQGGSQRSMTTHVQMDYLQVPTGWRPAGQTGDGRTSLSLTCSHPLEHRHSRCSNQRQQQADEPLLHHNNKDDLSRRSGRPLRYFLIGKATICFSTWLVFVLLMLLGVGVILTSLWFTFECKHRFQAVRPLLPNTASFCNTMGMPALFAACTVLFTVCGLACTGRKFTGYALIVIASVEILQAVTTLTFYNCRVLSAGRVLASVNASLLECHAAVHPGRETPNLARLQLGGISGGHLGGLPAKAPRGKVSMFPFSVTMPNTAEYPTPSPETRHKRRLGRSPWHKDMTSSRHLGDNSVGKTIKHENPILKEDKRSIEKVSHSTAGDTREISSYTSYDESRENTAHATRLNPEMKDVTVVSGRGDDAWSLNYQVDCASDSHFFQLLTQTASRNTVDKCKRVCQTYQAVCEVSWEDYIEEEAFLNMNDENSDYRSANGGASPPAVRGSSGSESVQGVHSSRPARGAKLSAHARQGDLQRVLENLGDREIQIRGRQHDFRRVVQQCGSRVEERVHNLCYYDNQVILPMSICAPVAYILFSCCFIYLARLEVARKERKGCSKIVTSASSSSSTNTASIMMSSTATQWSRAESTFSSASAASDEGEASGFLPRLRRSCVCFPWGRRVRLSKHSQSSHELLRLHTVMYSISTIVGLTMIESDVAAEAV